MITFDQIMPELEKIFQQHAEQAKRLSPLVVNRDLNGRVCLVVSQEHVGDKSLDELTQALQNALAPHTYAPKRAVLFEKDIDRFIKGEKGVYPLSEDFKAIHVLDRLATEGDWGLIREKADGPQRIVFYSMKGGVGRSTALAVTAWWLAERGYRVMVLDLDLESPGLSASLLPTDRRPAFGVTDWLVEDLVDNGPSLLKDMVATSELSRNGEILVIPAHGAEPGEYISKLGRVWMPKMNGNKREPWFHRLDRLLTKLEEERKPDLVLIDSRAGIDEIASTCLTALGTSLSLLFGMDSDETWSGYGVLFRHWNRLGVVPKIRERLQFVGAMVPETHPTEYLEGLRQRAYHVFSENLYDEVPPGDSGETLWNFDLADETAPHWPWPVNWHRGLATMRSIHNRLDEMDARQVEAIFGGLFQGVEMTLGQEEAS